MEVEENGCIIIISYPPAEELIKAEKESEARAKDLLASLSLSPPPSSSSLTHHQQQRCCYFCSKVIEPGKGRVYYRSLIFEHMHESRQHCILLKSTTPNVVKPKREKRGGGKRDVAKIPVWKRVIVCDSCYGKRG